MRLAVLLLALVSACTTSTEDSAQAAREAAAEAFQAECLADYQGALRYQQTTFPIRLNLHPKLGDANTEAFLAAAELWNRELGAELFEPVIATATYDCGNTSVVSNAHEVPEGDEAFCWWNSCWAFVRVRPEVTLTLEGAAHELGHALNLQHEADSHSVMAGFPHEGARISPYSRCRVEHALDGTGL